MSMQDPVADLLTRIRNAQRMNISNVSIPYSSFKEAILNVLKSEGYISNFSTTTQDSKKDLVVELKYHHGQPVIEKIDRVSKPSLRVYKGTNDLPQVRGGLGISIISTPKGVMSDRMARANNVGGEILCTVE